MYMYLVLSFFTGKQWGKFLLRSSVLYPGLAGYMVHTVDSDLLNFLVHASKIKFEQCCELKFRDVIFLMIVSCTGLIS